MAAECMSPIVIAYRAVQYLVNVAAAAHGCSFASEMGGVALELLAALAAVAGGGHIAGVCDCIVARAFCADTR